jgi:tRNA-specific 2-thiouridylase
MLLPIGGMRKAGVRELARTFGLPVFDKPDSQEICFVPDNDYAGLVERRAPGAARPGLIVDTAGRVLGEHGGQHRFTIGQRRGVGVAAGHPLYVINKDSATNTVMVGARGALLVSGCVAGEANWLVDATAFSGWTSCFAMYRYNMKPVAAAVRLVEPGCEGITPSGRSGRFEVRFDEPQTAVAPGQAVVLYAAAEPDWLIGGGWIESAAAHAR